MDKPILAAAVFDVTDPRGGRLHHPRSCDIEDCLFQHHARGLCGKHYYQEYRARGGRLNNSRSCERESCTRQHHAKGLCRPHYWEIHYVPPPPRITHAEIVEEYRMLGVSKEQAAPRIGVSVRTLERALKSQSVVLA